MSDNQFWYGDPRLLNVYEKAYYRDVSYRAWSQGAYNFEAHNKAVANGNRAKQSDPVQQYNQWKDPMERRAKPKITKDNLEKEFRQSQASQNAWLKNILHG